MNTDTIVTVGAAYGALQAVAQFFCLILPQHTIAWKVFKFIIGGPQRPVA